MTKNNKFDAKRASEEPFIVSIKDLPTVAVIIIRYSISDRALQLEYIEAS